jgi:hypothetical protein
MQTVSLEIEDDFFPHFKAMIECFVNDSKVIIVDLNDENIIQEEQEKKGQIIDSLCRQ